MAGPASTSLAVFDDHLSRIETGLNFVMTALSAKKNAPTVINWGADRYALNEMKSFLAVEVYPEELLYNTNYLSSVAAFEEFLRKSLASAILASVTKLKNFDELDTKLQDLHMKATGRLLARRSNPPQQLIGLNFFDLCRRIGTCIPGGTKFEINAEALCLLDDSMALESFIETLNLFGYQLSFDTLGADPAIGTALRTAGTRETSKALVNFVKDMVRQRNRIAHTGTTSSEVTYEILTDHIRVLRTLAIAIAANLEG
jgi:hypothetical protein